MLISRKQLKKVSVETRSGQFLGYVNDFELETDTGIIEKYHVKGTLVLAGFLQKSLLINRSQIINFDQEKMIVDDAVVKVKDSKIRKLAHIEKLEGAEPVITSEIDN